MYMYITCSIYWPIFIVLGTRRYNLLQGPFLLQAFLWHVRCIESTVLVFARVFASSFTFNTPVTCLWDDGKRWETCRWDTWRYYHQHYHTININSRFIHGCRFLTSCHSSYRAIQFVTFEWLSLRPYLLVAICMGFPGSPVPKTVLTLWQSLMEWTYLNWNWLRSK